MRLSREEAEAIRACARAHFGPLAIVRLFGSRADDAARGGDIDLHVVAQDEARAGHQTEGEFRDCLFLKIDEQRVDVVLRGPSHPLSEPVDVIARDAGVVLLNDNPRAVLREAAESVRRVADRLERALDAFGCLPTPTTANVAAYTEDQVDAVDIALKRYENLVALLQDRLFRRAAATSGEAGKVVTARDRANLMEKLGVIPSAERFRAFVETSNRLAHDYPNDPQRQGVLLAEAYAHARELLPVTRIAVARATAMAEAVL